MTSLVKRLNNKYLLVVLFSFVFVAGCSKEQKDEKYIVKIDDSVLSKSMVDSSLSDLANSAKGRDEFIHEWIETEILYKEAVKEGLTKEKGFISLLEKSKKELAATLFLKKLLTDNKIEPNDDEVPNYYNEKKDDFRLAEDLFKINSAEFSEFDKAIQCRDKLLASNWTTIENIYRNDKSVQIKKNILIYKSELQPIVLVRVMNTLLAGETSTVLQIEPGKYVIIQVIDKYIKDSLPPYDIVKDEARNRLIVLQKKEFIRNYITKLISDHNLEIERHIE